MHVTQLPGVVWDSSVSSGCIGRNEKGMRKAVPLAEALDTLSLGRLKRKPSAFSQIADV